ncbi:MAG: hypothetical protein ABR587_12475, partial [Candidatus Binatia bacterium]
MIKRGKYYYQAMVVGVGAATLLTGRPLFAADWSNESSPYYQEEGWLDISEWFDGNNYKDDATWNNDTFRDASAQGNDTAYGYSTRNDDDWFYDYYEPAFYGTYDQDNMFPYGAYYQDYDNDGSYDAVATYSDKNNDGTYDSYDYFTFSDSSDQQKHREKVKGQLPNESREQSATGAIEKMKQVDVRGGKHTVVQIQHQNQPMLVDLGRASDLASMNLKNGDTITVTGPRSKIGDKAILLAQELRFKEQNKQISRERREFRATVVSTRRVKVRGADHLLAIVDTNKPVGAQAGQQPSQHAGQLAGQQAGQMAGQMASQQAGKMAGQMAGQQAGQQPAQQPAAGMARAAVDLGPASKLGMQVTDGSQITFTAVPVKVKNRQLLIAQTIQKNDGSTAYIDRRSGLGE